MIEMKKKKGEVDKISAKLTLLLLLRVPDP